MIVNRKQVKYEWHLLNVYLLCGNDLIWENGATHYITHRIVLTCGKMHNKYHKLNKRMCKDKIPSKRNKYILLVSQIANHLDVVCVI